MAYKGIRVRYILAGASVASAAVGAAGGYILASKKLEKKYAEISNREIEEAKDFYEQQFKLKKIGDYADPDILAEKLGVEVNEVSDDEKPAPIEIHEETPVDRTLKAAAVALTDYQGISTTKRLIEKDEEEVVEETTVEEVEVTVKSIFGNEDPDEWNQELEEARRNPDRPYIISEEEFMACEMDLEQTQLTYYAGDDVLAGSDDKPIEDTDSIVGDSNLLRFGYGSRDRNIVFVRNEHISLEMEIAKSEGKFAEEVYGFIEHSDDHRIRKFRHED